MASRRKGWDSLSSAYRDRLSRKGITKEGYERGHKLDVARGHAETTEHGLKQAQRNPVKYRKYLNKRTKTGPTGKSQEDIAYDLNQAKDAAYFNFKGRLGHYLKYNE